MKALMQELRENALNAISDAESIDSLDALRVRYLGKKGELTAILKQMGKLSAEERPVMGQLANQIRSDLEASIENTRKRLEAAALEARLQMETLDVTIPAEELPLLFERFHKSDKSRSEDKDGYGLGLYVVKTILTQHKEHISVTSENGLTSFDFTLQLKSPHNT